MALLSGDGWLFLLRWFHFLAGITWIGMLYYFNFVQTPFFGSKFVADNAAVQAMVRVGMGAAVMPYLAIDPDDPEIRVCRLVPPIPQRQILVIRRADRTIAPIAERFISSTRAVCRRIEGARPRPISGG